jgi:GNAT superfamily N-acetyltransferase
MTQVKIIATDRELCEEILQADEANFAYFAERTDLPGVVMFCADRDDAPEFDIALVHHVPEDDADATLGEIVDHFASRGRRPRVRLSPISSPWDWPRRLHQAGFVQTDERHAYFTVPKAVQLTANPSVRVERARSVDDADRFSEIQAVGFDLSPGHAVWDRKLARRHVTASRHDFYLAWLEDRAVGAARCTHLPGGITALAALATIPEARGRGVGASLLARMIEDSRGAGSRVISGVVIPGSHAAGMYDRLGFMTLFETRSFAGSA